MTSNKFMRQNSQRRGMNMMSQALMQWAMQKDAHQQKLEDRIAQEDAANAQIKLLLEKRKLDQEWDIKKMDYRDILADQNTAASNERADAKAAADKIAETNEYNRERTDKLSDIENKPKTHRKVKVGDKLMWATETKDGLVLTKNEAPQGGINIYSGEKEKRAKSDQVIQEKTFEQKIAEKVVQTESLILKNPEDPAIQPYIGMFQATAMDTPYTYVWDRTPKRKWGLQTREVVGARKIDLPTRKTGEQITARDVLDTLEMNKGKTVTIPGTTQKITLNTYEDVLKVIGAYK